MRVSKGSSEVQFAKGIQGPADLVASRQGTPLGMRAVFLGDLL